MDLDPARVRPADSEVQRLLSGPRLARELLGWEPELKLADGLARTIDWIEANAGGFRADRYVI